MEKLTIYNYLVKYLTVVLTLLRVYCSIHFIVFVAFVPDNIFSKLTGRS